MTGFGSLGKNSTCSPTRLPGLGAPLNGETLSFSDATNNLTEPGVLSYGEYLGSKAAGFLARNKDEKQLFVKYPDTSGFLEFLSAMIEKEGKTSIIIVPDMGYGYNFRSGDDFSTNGESVLQDTASYYTDISLSDGGVLFIDYGELRNMERLSLEEKSHFLKNISTFACVDVGNGDKKTLSIIRELQEIGGATQYIFHSTGVNYVGNKWLTSIFEQLKTEDSPTTMNDLMGDGKLMPPEFITVPSGEETTNLDDAIINKYIELKDTQRDITSVGFCKDVKHMNQVARKLRKLGIACATVDPGTHSDISTSLEKLQNKEVDILLTLKDIGGEMSIPFVSGVVFFTPPSNKELCRQTLVALQYQEGKKPFIVEPESWPIGGSCSIQNIIARNNNIDPDKLHIGERPKRRGQGGSFQQEGNRVIQFPSVRKRLQYTGETLPDTDDKKMQKSILKQKSDNELIQLSVVQLNESEIKNRADVEILTISELKKQVSLNEPLKVYLARYGIGSISHIKEENREYIFTSLLGIEYLKKEGYLKNLRNYLQKYGITDYATCMACPLKKMRGKIQDDQALSYREMKGNSDFYYVHNNLLLQPNISDFDGRDRQGLAKLLFREDVDSLRDELREKLKNECDISDYTGLLRVKYRMQNPSLAALKRILNSEERYKKTLLDYDIHPSQLSGDDMEVLARDILGFDISEEFIKDTLGKKMNASLKELSKGIVLTYCWDYMMTMTQADFQKEVLSKSSSVLLFCKHFVEEGIKPSRITSKQKRTFLNKFKGIPGDNRLLSILLPRYKEIIEASIEKHNLDLDTIEGMQEAIKVSFSLRTFLGARHSITEVNSEEDLHKIQDMLSNSIVY